MKRIGHLIVFLAVLSCRDDDPIIEPGGVVSPTCNLERIDSWYGDQDVTRRDSIIYGPDGKMLKGYKFVRKPGKNWEYVETRIYSYSGNQMTLKTVRPSFTITGTFVFDAKSNLLEYYDDFFAARYKYSYNSKNELESFNGSLRYVIKDGNIIERRDIDTGELIDKFTYDSKPNPLRGLFFEPIGIDVKDYFKFYNKNNVLTETSMNPNIPFKSYSYSYSQDGLAEEQIQKEWDHVVYYNYKCE